MKLGDCENASSDPDNISPSGIIYKPYDPSLKTYIREVAPGENLEGLCVVCSSISFPEIDAINTGAFHRGTKLPVFNLPNAARLRASTCRLCCMLGLLREYMSRYHHESKDDDDPELCLAVSSLRRGPYTSLYVIPKHCRRIMKFSGLSTAYFLPSKDTSSVSVSQDWRIVDFENLSSQLQSHGQPHQSKQLSAGIPGLRLIDCTRLESVDAPYQAEYLALSYMWGKRKSTQNDVERRGQSLDFEKLLRTVSDAIRFTVRLGKRYLWVDYLCVDQHNTENAQKQLTDTGQIFEFAWAVIVSLGSSNNAPLPGVSTNRKSPNAAVVFGGTLLIEPTQQHRREVIESLWRIRGWIW